MAVLFFDGLLTDAAQAGVYFLPEPDVDELLEAAAVNRFPCLRVNLRHCHGDAELRLRIAGVLDMAPHVVCDWSALADALEQQRDPATRGQVLLLEHSEGLRAGTRDDFKAAMEALQAASVDWRGRGLPLWSFIVMDESEFDAL